ncbi:hypothetical protein ACFST9_00340 [Hymenobacter monticola]|uniref:Uncharacterized protein n=1 Tax=Hymenobacter monticola TaxID=1705399 RepID=A0ABY4BD24_9BACT|nr:hypothetical protein [Hymenobacter monticola]UOE36789.1 hypothetical protein MTP16_25265 [Hymenobacter monticola]
MVTTDAICLVRNSCGRTPWSHSLFLFAVLAGCQPDQPKKQTAPPPTPVTPPAGAAQLAPLAPPISQTPEPTKPLAPEPPAIERYRVLPTTRSYMGTVGGEPATLALTWVRPDSAVGRVYFWRPATEYELTTASRHRPGRLLAQSPGCWGFLSGADAPGYWQVTSGPGPQLRGYWRDPAGRRQSFTLRESYQRSVRYARENLSIDESGADEAGDQRPWHESDFLHLLDGPAARSALARALRPGRARQRAIVLDNEGQAFCNSILDVRLNDFYLLSFYRHELIDPIEGTNDELLKAWLFDLASGRKLTIASQLQPGYELPLRRLLTRQLRHNPRFNYLNPELNPSAPDAWHWSHEPDQSATLVSLPNEDEALALTATGLEATYCSNSLFDNGGPFTPRFPVVVPYAELRPLVRPGTPLARMLWARGLW